MFEFNEWEVDLVVWVILVIVVMVLIGYFFVVFFVDNMIVFVDWDIVLVIFDVFVWVGRGVEIMFLSICVVIIIGLLCDWVLVISDVWMVGNMC